MAPTLYNTILARNVRAARNRLGLSQADVVDRMRSLGFPGWHKPTLGNIERGDRRLLADEAAGLAFALETTLGRLLAPLDEDVTVEFAADGLTVPVLTVQLSAAGRVVAGALWWDGAKPVFAEPDYPPAVRDAMARMARSEWPPES